MFVKDGNTYRKVYIRKNGSKFFVRDGKRVDLSPSRVIVNTKPRKDCPHGKERVPSGRCSKKCTPPKTRNPRTNRCKSPARRSSSTYTPTSSSWDNMPRPSPLVRSRANARSPSRSLSRSSSWNNMPGPSPLVRSRANAQSQYN